MDITQEKGILMNLEKIVNHLHPCTKYFIIETKFMSLAFCSILVAGQLESRGSISEYKTILRLELSIVPEKVI